MQPTVEELTLREVEAFPSTNLTRIYHSAGRRLPEAVGGGCLWMAARLSRLLRQRRPSLRIAHYDLGASGSHTTTVSDDGRERLLYEPSLFQARPFSLTRFEADPRCCTCEVYPPADNQPPKLKFSWTPDHRLHMELLSPRGNPKRQYQYVFQAPVEVNEDDPYAGLPFIEPQDQIYVYVLNEDFSKNVVMMNTRTRRINAGRARDKLYVDSEPGFSSRFERMATRLQLTDGQLRTLLHEAADIHHTHYPDP